MSSGFLLSPFLVLSLSPKFNTNISIIMTVTTSSFSWHPLLMKTLSCTHVLLLILRPWVGWWCNQWWLMLYKMLTDWKLKFPWEKGKNGEDIKEWRSQGICTKVTQLPGFEVGTKTNRSPSQRFVILGVTRTSEFCPLWETRGRTDLLGFSGSSFDVDASSLGHGG